MKKNISFFLILLFLLIGFSGKFRLLAKEDPNYLTEHYTGLMPSTGDVKVLVLLIEFPDYVHDWRYSNDFVKDYLFGPSKDDHESITSFYQKSSYNKLNIEAEVLGWYKTKNRSRYYTSNYSDYASDHIITEALEYYESKGTDFSIFDSDNDGYVDAVYAIYSKDYNENSDIWWAYQSYLEPELTLDNKIISNYCWASISFIEYDNALTFIHETGHMLGLDDYYDYNEDDGPYGGLGGADLMDDALGDHGPISKILLGWINPIIIETKDFFDVTINLSPFVSSGQVILITPEFSDFYGEYYLIDYYTPESINDTNSYFTKAGIRIYHVNAKLGPGGEYGFYETIFEYDNSDTYYKFVELIEADGNDDILLVEYAENSDLFYSGDVFSVDSKPNNKMHHGVDPKFVLSVNEIEPSNAVIKVTSSKIKMTLSFIDGLNKIKEVHNNKTNQILN